jgi:Ca2+-binding RTX toxin-like protein
MKKIALLLTAIMGVLLLFSGMALAATITCAGRFDCLGTNNADTLEGTASKDLMHARAGADTLKGLGEMDYMYGQGGADRLLGGPALDDLIGGAGNDELRGGAGGDFYFFGDGWGKDTITDEATPKTQLSFFDPNAGLAAANLVVDLVSGTGPEAKDESGTNTINWEGNVIETVVSGNGDDHITGNAADNVINGNGGNDTILGKAGDDTTIGGDGDDEIDVDDQSFDDNVYCGAGEDTVYYDRDSYYGFVHDYVTTDCEHLHAR